MPVNSSGSARGVRLAIGLVVLSFGAACGRVPPLADARESPTALMTEVLHAFRSRDRNRLESLSISELEFRDHVWPRLPAARPERKLPMSYVWGELRQKSDAALASTLSRLGGQRYELLDVQFDAEAASYGTYTVHPGTRVRVRTPAGADEEIRVCGSLLEQNGRWKVFSYVTDD